MGFWKSEFDKKVRPAIERYAALYGEDPQHVRIKMSLDEKGKAAFWTVIKRQVRERVKFLHIYYNLSTKLDVTGRTMLIRRFIRKALSGLAEEYKIRLDMVNVLVVLDGTEIFLFLMDGLDKVKLLEEEELLSDERIAADTLELEQDPQIEQNE